MKVISPDNTTHIIDYIYRRELVGNPVFELTNETTKVSENLSATQITTIDGLSTMYFVKTVSNNEKYTMKVTDDDGVVYRCKVFVTNQDVQNFDKTKGFITYE